VKIRVTLWPSDRDERQEYEVDEVDAGPGCLRLVARAPGPMNTVTLIPWWAIDSVTYEVPRLMPHPGVES